MSSWRKFFLSLAALLVSFLIAVAFIVNGVLSRAPDVSKKSPYGHYLIESVPASSLLTPRDSVYLRFTDLNDLGHVYRTPLFSDVSLDMTADESDDAVGVVFIMLDKKNKEFTLALSNPRKHWLDLFISNTPYEVIPN
ncbi:hypothetical protein [Pseudomonas siliginis]|uniref:hypothetical protein n=1 Tax=Pseudomonas siliginis TaxID=2842346 RepID=UPI0020936238|nr:hypothetical protein [Pseudomonas siliginis]MEB2650198.1 hypothetical protein [Pseudomonas siliginis]UST74388.1 hypothetical protein NF675_25945 [Pseudomonas siliginis]UST90188.1 hypothetical protein NF678_25850 [Pseudomonas siliginis]UVL94414.1 hypothetical protein LOY48_25785 [Pseudomonas siliginis]